MEVVTREISVFIRSVQHGAGRILRNKGGAEMTQEQEALDSQGETPIDRSAWQFKMPLREWIFRTLLFVAVVSLAIAVMVVSVRTAKAPSDGALGRVDSGMVVSMVEERPQTASVELRKWPPQIGTVTWTEHAGYVFPKLEIPPNDLYGGTSNGREADGDKFALARSILPNERNPMRVAAVRHWDNPKVILVAITIVTRANEQGNPFYNPHLYVTRDGAKTWQEIQLSNPLSSKAIDEVRIERVPQLIVQVRSLGGSWFEGIVRP